MTSLFFSFFFVSCCVAGVLILHKVESSAREIARYWEFCPHVSFPYSFFSTVFSLNMKVGHRNPTLYATGPSEKCQACFAAATLFLFSALGVTSAQALVHQFPTTRSGEHLDTRQDSYFTTMQQREKFCLLENSCFMFSTTTFSSHSFWHFSFCTFTIITVSRTPTFELI